eukprot:1601614-Rhodomonas_salina.3
MRRALIASAEKDGSIVLSVPLSCFATPCTDRTAWRSCAWYWHIVLVRFCTGLPARIGHFRVYNDTNPAGKYVLDLVSTTILLRALYEMFGTDVEYRTTRASERIGSYPLPSYAPATVVLTYCTMLPEMYWLL